MNKSRGRLPSINCPDCGGRAIVRDSQPITDTVRELRLNCANDDCGCSFVSQLSVIRLLRRGARPNPEIHIPFGRWSKPANDDHPQPANDDHDVMAAVGAVMST